ncbi:uncharacterized protein LOC114574657 isoform X1 [Exaiptasia diaphana]|uniref:Uncharacterized protein n=1 Tax=Exaiptasia diaphana TaxID=2652724 RepID=A0A913YEA3_EXADI|nr:uncharacterized protein LOC114574657 isoform X1 [Exaiptasia diaphana]
MAVRENAFLVFDAAFLKEGCVLSHATAIIFLVLCSPNLNVDLIRNQHSLTAPSGLKKLLQKYSKKDGEKPDDMRHRIYRRLWCIMWYGSQIGQSAMSDNQKPTYVYPQELKDIVRAIIPGQLSDFPNPTGPHVYEITLQDLVNAKWPR